MVRGIEYVRVPAAQAGLREPSSQLASPNSSDPAQALAQLAAVSSGVSKQARARRRGVPATEYRAQVSLDKLAGQVQAMNGAEAAEGVRQQEQAFGQTSLPVQVWVDAQHLVRQIRYQTPVTAARSGGAGAQTATETMTFTSFGAPVTITPPSASQVADITSQAIQQAQASSG